MTPLLVPPTAAATTRPFAAAKTTTAFILVDDLINELRRHGDQIAEQHAFERKDAVLKNAKKSARKEERGSKAKKAELGTSADKIMKPYRAPCRRMESRDTFIKQHAAQRE